MNIVFTNSAYKLSKCTAYSFWICYTGACIAGLCGIVGLVAWIEPLYVYGYAVGFSFALILAIYLPSLFIYKLFQINKQVMENNSIQPRVSMVPNTKSDTQSHSPSVSITKRLKTRKTTDINRDNSILTVIRKCTILTFVSLISTWTIFICLMVAFNHCCSDFLLILWGYALIIDRWSNFGCVMLSNNFFDSYYMKICGWIDNCVGECCFKEMVDGGDKEKELSSYIDSTATKISAETSE